MAMVSCLRKIAGPNLLKRRRSKDADPTTPGPPGLIWIPTHGIQARRWARLQKL
jgi:hypothetical protein